MTANARKLGLEELISNAMELPVLPVTTQKVLSMMADPDVSIEKVKRLITSDPGLVAKLMTVANSAFYGGYRNLQNLSQAILRLGLNSVRSIIVATSMKNVYKRFGLAEKLLWEQSIGSALASGIIARHTRVVDHEDAFIGGLLHDVGKVVLNNENPAGFARVMEMVYNDSLPFSIAEKEVFEFSHRDVGALVVKKWGFPENLELLIRVFDDREAVSKDRYLNNLVTVITMADLMCQKFGMGWRKPAGSDTDFGALPEALGLSQDDMNKLFELVKAAFVQGADFP